MSFPFDWQGKELDESDLLCFSAEFAETVNLFVPCDEVFFVGPHAGGEMSGNWKAGVEMVRNEQKPVVDVADSEYLFLPLWAGDALLGVAILVNRQPTYGDSSSSWLVAQSRLVSKEMTRVKQYALDPLTGLPGGQAMNRRLNALLAAGTSAEKDSFSLSLLEIHPRAKDGEQAVAAISRSAAFVDSLIGHLVTPYHLGNGIFALLWPGEGEEQTRKMADMLLRWLKREGYGGSQIGIRTCTPGEKMSSEQIALQAWDALRVARKRGPFALCSYLSLSNREAHPLCPFSGQVLEDLKKMWQKSSAFYLVLLHRDLVKKGNGSLAHRLDWLDEPLVVVDEHEAFVYLEGVDSKQAEKWCGKFQEWAAQQGVSFSMGAAQYPHENFSKADTVANCRKALLHTSFYGPGSLTFFDGVSLNISGDIYYNEGDLANAVKEYKLGLSLDPKNINLLNSLGVTLTQMNLYKKAIPLFKEALSNDPADFMALFNLGFAYLALGEEECALATFEQARQVQDDNFDLLLQLGKLYCQAGRYVDAVAVLSQGEQVGPVGIRDISHGAVYCYLGEAYKGLGENEKAMSCLQRAVRHNPRDAAALSLLGELYSEEGQGDDVALSLCRQAVELDDSQWQHWARLGAVLLSTKDYEEAYEAVQCGLALDRSNNTLILILAKIYEKQGKKGLAQKMYKKVKK